MSQHEFESVHGERRVMVRMGWDAPLQHYFMTVKPAQNNGGGGGFPVYSNLSDVELDGGAADPAYFWKKLAALGIACKLQSIIDEELRSDAASNVGNRIVRYSADGVIDEK